MKESDVKYSKILSFSSQVLVVVRKIFAADAFSPIWASGNNAFVFAFCFDATVMNLETAIKWVMKYKILQSRTFQWIESLENIWVHGLSPGV